MFAEIEAQNLRTPYCKRTHTSVGSVVLVNDIVTYTPVNRKFNMVRIGRMEVLCDSYSHNCVSKYNTFLLSVEMLGIRKQYIVYTTSHLC